MESKVLPLNRRKRASADFLPYGKQISVTNLVKEGFGGFFCRMGSRVLPLNRRKGASAAFSAVPEAKFCRQTGKRERLQLLLPCEKRRSGTKIVIRGCRPLLLL